MHNNLYGYVLYDLSVEQSSFELTQGHFELLEAGKDGQAMTTKSDIEIGQVWQILYPKYEVGFLHDYFVILSQYTDSWNIGTFWWSGKSKQWGGAREKILTSSEIYEIGEYVGHIRSLL